MVVMVVFNKGVVTVTKIVVGCILGGVWGFKKVVQAAFLFY